MAQTKTILVADDDPHNRTIFSDFFTSLGHKVLEAESGEEAFKLLNENEVDLLVTDLRMQNGTGIELLRKIRRLKLKESNPRKLSIFVCTALLDGGEGYLKALGADAVFIKPVELKELKNALHSIFD